MLEMDQTSVLVDFKAEVESHECFQVRAVLKISLSLNFIRFIIHIS